MKKLSVLFLALVIAFALSSFETKAIGITIKVEFGKRNAEGNCGPGKGICSVTIGGTLRAAPGQSGADVEVVDGTAELKNGKLYVTVPKAINEKAKSERGTYSVTIDKTVLVDPSVAKELGAPGLMLVPGTYEMSGNTFVFNVKSPRDAATGQATGKRSNIAIDEPGVHKVTAPRDAATGQSSGKRQH
jgi:uncharacterized low-complexity protein